MLAQLKREVPVDEAKIKPLEERFDVLEKNQMSIREEDKHNI